MIALLFLLLTIVPAGATTWFNPVPNTLVDGVPLDAPKVNANFASIRADGNAGAANLLAQAAAIPFLGLPSGAVVMVSATTCPTGYNVANGSNGTADLRGIYIRGTGGLAAARGTLQASAMQSHTHGPTALLQGVGNAAGVAGPGAVLTFLTGISFNSSPPNTNTQANGTFETRPQSVVLTNCAKQ